MNRALISITSVWAAFFLAACSGSSPSTGSDTSQGGSGGGSGAQTGGAGTIGGSNAGTVGGSNAGGGTNAGNTGGINSGNTGGVNSGNTGGINSGNTGGNNAGNTGGVNSGNTGGINSGNTGGNNAGNTGGTRAGNTGGASTSGTGGTNAGNTGGTKAGTGGSPPTGGAPAATGGSTSTAPICITSAQGAYWQTATVTTVTSGTADVTVNDGTANQTWEGFGGCFNEMGWNQLSTTALQTQAINALFGTDGAHFVLGRIPIGASDYAISRYTDDDTANPNDPAPNTAGSNRPPADTSMASFSITRDTQKLIPYIQAALAVNPNIRLWASPWTPPVWMKTGYKTNSGADSSKPATKPSYFDGGNMVNSSSNFTAYASYLVKWLQAYKAQGITVETVSAQNEPGYDQNYPSCLWDSATYVSFIKVLGPALSSASLSTKVMGGTMSNPNDSSILSALMGDATAKTYIGVVGVQWGMLDNAVSSPSTFSAYGVPLWATEHKCGNYPWNPSGLPAYKSTAPNDQAYGVESWGYIRDAITKAKVTAYNAWNMVLDNVGLGIDTTRQWAQDSLLTVSGGTLTMTPAYYVFRHLSQYAQPGAKVVATTGGDAVAFKNPDGSIVAVVYNSGAAKTSIVTLGGTRYQFAMPGNGWATIKK